MKAKFWIDNITKEAMPLDCTVDLGDYGYSNEDLAEMHPDEIQSILDRISFELMREYVDWGLDLCHSPAQSTIQLSLWDHKGNELLTSKPVTIEYYSVNEFYLAVDSLKEEFRKTTGSQGGRLDVYIAFKDVTNTSSSSQAICEEAPNPKFYLDESG